MHMNRTSICRASTCEESISVAGAHRVRGLGGSVKCEGFFAERETDRERHSEKERERERGEGGGASLSKHLLLTHQQPV